MDGMQCFEFEELKNLDPHHLEILKTAVRRTINDSKEIHEIIRKTVDPLYSGLAKQPQNGTPPDPGP